MAAPSSGPATASAGLPPAAGAGARSAPLYAAAVVGLARLGRLRDEAASDSGAAGAWAGLPWEGSGRLKAAAAAVAESGAGRPRGAGAVGPEAALVLDLCAAHAAVAVGVPAPWAALPSVCGTLDSAPGSDAVTPALADAARAALEALPHPLSSPLSVAAGGAWAVAVAAAAAGVDAVAAAKCFAELLSGAVEAAGGGEGVTAPLGPPARAGPSA